MSTASTDDTFGERQRHEPGARPEIDAHVIRLGFGDREQRLEHLLERRRAREQGLSLTGPAPGLLKQLTKTVLEMALNQEMTEHQGHEKHRPVTSETGNVRNGTRPKTVLTENLGEVGTEVRRDQGPL